MKDQAIEATVASVAHKATTAGAGTVLFGWLTLNDLALVIGVIVTIAGFVVNLYYKRKADHRDSALHDAELEKLRRQ